MIYLKSILAVKDNSGLKYVKVIKLLGNSSFKKQVNIGDLIVTSIYERKKIDLREKKKIIKKTINKALIVSTKKPFQRKDGVFVKYDKSSCIIFNSDVKELDIHDKKKKVNLKLFVPIIKELNAKDYKQVVYYAQKIY